MAYEDDGDDGDFVFFALAVASVYFFWQLYRDRIAASAGGGYFDAAPPAADPTSGILNILVPLNLSPTGAAFIKAQEGFRASAYADGGGHSIGYGHQIQPGENIIAPISQAEGERLFAADSGAAAKVVSDAVKVQLTQSQFDALVDFVYNLGPQAFLSSTLLRLLNSGDYFGAAQEFLRFVHSGGQVNSGLVARRQADQQLFTGG